MKHVSLDSMVFIYLFESDPKLSPFIKSLLYQIQRKQMIATTSIISVIEALSPKKYLHNALVLEECTRFFQEMPNLTIVPVDWTIGEMAAKLRQTYEALRTPDALHIATAIIAHADVFITNDAQLLKLRNLPIPITSLSRISQIL